MPAPVIGFHGKLPARGDFVTRGLPSSFLSAWEAWVDTALAASRDLLGDAWREAWMTAPVWRFCLPAGACGPDPALGVMMPSIDRVGRLYPLTIAVLLPGATGTPDPDAADSLLNHAEDAGRSALADGLDPDALRDLIAGIPIDVMAAPGSSAVWWTDGSETIDPISLSLDGLPEMPEHAAMLAGEPGAIAAPEAVDPVVETDPAPPGPEDGTPARAEPTPTEPVEGARAEPALTEAGPTEPVPIERGGSEPVAAEAGKAETVETAAAPGGSTQTGTGRAGMAEAEAVRAEVPRTETGQTETSQTGTSQTGTSKIDANQAGTHPTPPTQPGLAPTDATPTPTTTPDDGLPLGKGGTEGASA